jgi:mannosyltransferase OCH1-like enzyme
MINKKWQILLLIISLIGIIIWLIFQILEYKSSLLMIYEFDINQYFNQSNQRVRIPRIIHQTYKSHQVPSIWNSTVNSVMKINKKHFQYRRWSHIEMAEFVKKHEYEFYKNTYIKYPYEMQRIDSFRYVLMYHIGGIYVDMDNRCNRPFIDLINTLENIDPNVDDLACFPRRESFGVESDLLISSVNHPFYRQLILNLNSFNRKYLLHFWTMLISAGPIYVSIQKLFFISSKNSTIRLLDFDVFRPMFIRKENGLTWIQQDAHIIFYICEQIYTICWYLKRLLILFFIFSFIKWFKRKTKFNFKQNFIFLK